MKTPIQELIEHLETWMLDDKEVQQNPTKYDERLVQYANQMEQVKQHFVRMCKSMLEKEKEAIMNAYDIGWSDGKIDQDLNDLYYNETFNTNQKNLPDSTNGYTYYPQEHKTIFNTKEK